MYPLEKCQVFGEKRREREKEKKVKEKEKAKEGLMLFHRSSFQNS